MQKPAAAGRTGGGQLGLVLLEPALGAAAVEAEGGPVAEHLPALLTHPVGGLAHTHTLVA